MADWVSSCPVGEKTSLVDSGKHYEENSSFDTSPMQPMSWRQKLEPTLVPSSRTWDARWLQEVKSFLD